MAASFAASTWLTAQPVDDRFVAAVFPPWWSAARSVDAVIAAGGTFVGWGGLSSIVLTRAEHADFPARLQAAGALFLLDPSPLGFCTSHVGTSSTREAIL
jgi:hypothetical protein